MRLKEFAAAAREAFAVSRTMDNPGGGTSEVLQLTEDAVTCKRGDSTIRVRLADLHRAYLKFRGGRVSSTDLREFLPSVFDSSARPAGHSCTFLSLLLQRMGLAGEPSGSGRRGDPFALDLPNLGEHAPRDTKDEPH